MSFPIGTVPVSLAQSSCELDHSLTIGTITYLAPTPALEVSRCRIMPDIVAMSLKQCAFAGMEAIHKAEHKRLRRLMTNQ